MKLLTKIALITVTTLSLSVITPAKADIIITEVDPSGSGTSTYAADWFELTNTGSSSVDITGWKMDDNSNSFSNAVALNGVTSIGAGKSVVFIEDTSASSDSDLINAFEQAWFGSNVPAGFTIGTYGGSGVGLSTGSDAVNIFNSTGTRITGVEFGSSTTGVTFDNSAGVTNDGTISTLSVAGKNGAFISPTGEVGSPGAVPEPSTYALMIGGFAALVGLQVLRRNKVA